MHYYSIIIGEAIIKSSCKVHFIGERPINKKVLLVLAQDKYAEIVSLIPDPYNWKTYPLMNIEFWKKHQITDINEAKKLLDQSHHQVIKWIDQFSNEALLTKNIFLERILRIWQAPLFPLHLVIMIGH